MRMQSCYKLLTALVLVAAASTAADAQAPTLRGTFVHDVDASDSMDQIVDAGMSRLGRIYNVWPISSQAKSRLKETNLPYAWIQILPEGDMVTVNTDHWKLTLPKNGRMEDWEREPGDLIDVSTQMQSGRLEIAFDAEDGRRVNVYTLSNGGRTLTMDVTVTSPKLDSPLNYKQVYQRRD